MSNPHPFTGFGDDWNTSVKLTVLLDGDRWPDWESPVRKSVMDICHSSRSIHQYGGREDWTITLRLGIDTLAGLELLDAVQGLVATLRIPWGVTKTAGGTHEVHAGAEYLELPDTVLESVQVDERESHPDGYREVLATFSRAYDLNSYYGFAPYGEES